MRYLSSHLAHLVDLNGVCKVTLTSSQKSLLLVKMWLAFFFFFLILFSSRSEATILTPACKHLKSWFFSASELTNHSNVHTGPIHHPAFLTFPLIIPQFCFSTFLWYCLLFFLIRKHWSKHTSGHNIMLDSEQNRLRESRWARLCSKKVLWPPTAFWGIPVTVSNYINRLLKEIIHVKLKEQFCFA